MSYDEIMAIMAHEYQLTLAQSEADSCYINIYSGEQGQFQEGKNMPPSPLKNPDSHYSYTCLVALFPVMSLNCTGMNR